MTLQCFVALCLWPILNVMYKIRRWGRLPRQRAATLAISNHVHDLDTLAVVVALAIDGPQSKPIYSVASRRLFEPGFTAARAPRLAPALRSANWGSLFRRLSLLPIEDDLFARSIASLALAVERLDGDLPFREVFDERTVGDLEDVVWDQPLSQLRTNRAFLVGQKTVSLRALREPYRSEVLALTRASVEQDSARLEKLLEGGATLYLTPEGRLSRDGRLGRLRGALSRMAALADVYVIGISYDVFAGERLSMQYRVMKPARPDDLAASLTAARPVNVSQLLSAWLVETKRSFTLAEAIAGVRSSLAALPSNAFVDPDFKGDLAGLVGRAVASLRRLGGLAREPGAFQRCASCVHPKFREVPDMIAFQAIFFNETTEALRKLSGGERRGV